MFEFFEDCSVGGISCVLEVVLVVLLCDVKGEVVVVFGGVLCF